MSHHKHLRHAVTAVAAVTLTFAMTACGASTSKSSDGDTAASSGPKSDEAVAAQKILDEYTKVPTAIRQTTPLDSAPPTGKKVIWLKCDIPSCTTEGQGIEAAAKLAGWDYEAITYKSADPATLTTAFKRALSEKPDYVIESGVPPEAGWGTLIPDFKAAGIPIIASYIGTEPKDLPDGVIANVGGPAVFDEYAKQVANWFIADSNGTGKALIHRVDAYPILKSYSDSLVKYIKAGCSKCDISTVVQSSAADVGAQKVVPAIVSGMKRNPDLTYMLSADIEFLDSLPSAMSAAGLERKVAGQSPTLAGLGLVKSGKFAMAPTHPSIQAGWVTMDVAFRSALGMDISDDDNYMPTRTLLPGGDFPTDKLIDEPDDFADQFTTLWKLG